MYGQPVRMTMEGVQNMGFTFNGSGIRFYGQRDFRPDGSYMTTEWVVLFWVPLIPLRSLRVRSGERRDSYLFVLSSSSQNYAVYETRAPYWKQVLYTYGYMALVAGWAVGL